MTVPSIFLFPLSTESKDVTQLLNEYGGCKLHITFFCSSHIICDILFNQSFNWSLRPKGEGRSGPKGLCYREKNFVIFVGLTLKCHSSVPFH